MIDSRPNNSCVRIKSRQTRIVMKTNTLIATVRAYCGTNRSPATLLSYRTRLRRFRELYNERDFGTLTPLEIDEHLELAGAGMSDSTRHHDAMALERLQKFALDHKLIERPIFGKLD